MNLLPSRKIAFEKAVFLLLHGILGEKNSLGARLRTRKVTGRDAALPAPLLSAFEMLVARGTVGALPQTPQGTDEKGRSPPLTLQGEIFPLTPFRD